MNVEDDDDCSQAQILVEQFDSRTSGAQGGLTIAISYPIDSKDMCIHIYVCQTARSMERSVFFFLKSHISAPGAQNSPILFS